MSAGRGSAATASEVGEEAEALLAHYLGLPPSGGYGGRVGSSTVPDDLWVTSAYAGEYQEPAPSDEQVADIEAELGYRLPTAYVALARSQNGGLLRRNAHPSPRPTTWAADHVGVTGIFAIGRAATCSLCGDAGQRLWLEEWGYPALGVYFADTPSAGHDMIALDYRSCGPEGEPSVVHVDQEVDYAVTELAVTFADFVSGLVEEGSLPD